MKCETYPDWLNNYQLLKVYCSIKFEDCSPSYVVSKASSRKADLLVFEIWPLLYVHKPVGPSGGKVTQISRFESFPLYLMT
jgi:hypothetical protein